MDLRPAQRSARSLGAGLARAADGPIRGVKVHRLPGTIPAPLIFMRYPRRAGTGGRYPSVISFRCSSDFVQPVESISSKASSAFMVTVKRVPPSSSAKS